MQTLERVLMCLLAPLLASIYNSPTAVAIFILETKIIGPHNLLMPTTITITIQQKFLIYARIQQTKNFESCAPRRILQVISWRILILPGPGTIFKLFLKAQSNMLKFVNELLSISSKNYVEKFENQI